MLWLIRLQAITTQVFTQVKKTRNHKIKHCNISCKRLLKLEEKNTEEVLL